MKKELVFGFTAWLPIAIVLGYIGYRQEVIPLMQVFSHTTRAYIWNSNAEQGFVKRLDILESVTEACKKNQLSKIVTW